MEEKFEEKYLDVLQNIEFSLVTSYKANPNLVDTGTMYVIDTLIKFYTGQMQGREVALPQFKPEEQATYDKVKEVCEWRLGRAPWVINKGEEVKLESRALTVEEIIACLKRIRKSIEKWYKESGRRGYYDFVKRFVQ